jgi:hypothetical protein
MPCLIGCFALFFPRLVIILLVLFSDYIGNAYQTWIWPLLGFIFLPLTTLAYAWAFHSTGGAVQGGWIIVIIIAGLIDLGIIGGGASSKHTRRVVTGKG